MALSSGVMSITVEISKGSKDLDTSCRQDAYCALRAGDQTFRTNTVRHGDCGPVWNETFNVELMDEDCVELQVKDDNLFGDPHISHAAFSLARARECGSNRLEVPVLSRNTGRLLGTVTVSLRWAPNQQPCPNPCGQQQQQQPAGSVAYGQPPVAAAACPVVFASPLAERLYWRRMYWAERRAARRQAWRAGLWGPAAAVGELRYRVGTAWAALRGGGAG